MTSRPDETRAIIEEADRRIAERGEVLTPEISAVVQCHPAEVYRVLVAAGYQHVGVTRFHGPGHVN